MHKYVLSNTVTITTAAEWESIYWKKPIKIWATDVSVGPISDSSVNMCGPATPIPSASVLECIQYQQKRGLKRTDDVIQ